MTSSARFSSFDGLRGWAALVVAVSHIASNFIFSSLKFPTLSSLTAGPTPTVSYLGRFMEACFLSLYWNFQNGALAVRVFFVLSGFVLSIGTLLTGNPRVILNQAVRRYPRLTIPILAATFIGFVLMISGGMHNVAAASVGGRGWIDEFYSFPASMIDALKFAVLDVYFHYDPEHSYDFAMWTMGVEIAGSFVTFSILFLRGGGKWTLILYPIAATMLLLIQPNLICFLFGMLIAELVANKSLSVNRSVKWASVALSPVLLFGSIVASKLPDNSVKELWLTLLAAEIVVLVAVVPTVRAALSGGLSQALGAISFPLYLVHPLVLCSIGSTMALDFLNAGGPFSLAARLLVVTSILVTSVIAAIAFLPVERLAVGTSRALGNFFIPLARAAVTKAAVTNHGYDP